VTFGQRGPADILRAVVAAGRESRVSAGEMRARLERAWSGLSRAEQLALGGTLAAALLAGGGMLVRSGLKAMAPLSIAEMRRMETKELLRSFRTGSERQKDAIAKFCFCRVHDVRELLFLDDNLTASARQVLDHILDLKEREWEKQPTHSNAAQALFLKEALNLANFDPNEDDDFSEMQTHDPETYKRAREKATHEGIAEILDKMNTAQEGTDDYRKYSKAVGSFKRFYLGLLVEKHKIRGALFPVTNELDELGRHSKYGDIETWDVRQVTDMTNAFAPGIHRVKGAGSGSFWGAKPDGAAATYNDMDISFWDTRNVNIMSGMFDGYEGTVEVGGNVEVGSAISESKKPKKVRSLTHREDSSVTEDRVGGMVFGQSVPRSYV
jgi:hypothetical protein